MHGGLLLRLVGSRLYGGLLLRSVGSRMDGGLLMRSVGSRLHGGLLMRSVGSRMARKQHMYFFWCLCDYCVLVFLCYWESIN